MRTRGELPAITDSGMAGIRDCGIIDTTCLVSCDGNCTETNHDEVLDGTEHCLVGINVCHSELTEGDVLAELGCAIPLGFRMQIVQCK